jgi:hypothetical protein
MHLQKDENPLFMRVSSHGVGGHMNCLRRFAKTGARRYLPKRPRPKKPRISSTRTMMMMIQRIDT